jgi:hypothetical protein
MLALPGVPLARTRAEVFDDLILDAVEDLETRYGADLGALEFAVEQVPPRDADLEFDPEVVMDRGVPLGRLFREGTPGSPEPLIVLYRRPVEARARDHLDRGEVVFAVVAELAAEYLGRDLD